MSELAALAPEVEASLGIDADAAAAHGPSHVCEALAAVVATLRSESAPGAWDAPPPLLHALADRLAAPRAWLELDRVVHELMSDLLLDAVAAPDSARADALAARAFALRTIARHDALWSGAGPRGGCAYGYDSLLASVRMRAIAA